MLNESSGDYEGVASRKPHSDKIRTPEFVGEIQSIIYNDPSKSVWSIVRDMVVFEFLTRNLVHEDFRYFSYKMRNCKSLSQTIKDKWKDFTAKLFNKLKQPVQLNILPFRSFKWNVLEFFQNMRVTTKKKDTFSFNTKIKNHCITLGRGKSFSIF